MKTREEGGEMINLDFFFLQNILFGAIFMKISTFTF